MDELLTCGDNSCCLDKPQGMGSNGGCVCLEGLRVQERLRVSYYIQREKARVEALEAENKEKQGEIWELNAEVCDLKDELWDYKDGYTEYAKENKELRAKWETVEGLLANGRLFAFMTAKNSYDLRHVELAEAYIKEIDAYGKLKEVGE